MNIGVLTARSLHSKLVILPLRLIRPQRTDMAKSPPLSVFCSYAHEDASLQAKVGDSLALLVREGKIHKPWDAQQAWLVSELKNAPAEKALIVAVHQPIYS